jgi:membrane associated rhomboid family serine protease
VSQTATPREPMLRAPAIILWLCALYLLVQLVMATSGPGSQNFFLVHLGLFPARFFAEGLNGLPGGLGQGLVTLVSYSFLHGGWSHCILNMVWLLAFGAPVAQRLGTRRFLLLFVLCIVLAGLGQIMVAPRADWLIPIIGASGGVSGMMGAAARFAFPDTRWLSPQAARAARPLLALRDVPKRRPVIMFIIIWLGLNLIFGLLGPGGYATPDGQPANIAWVAHLAGFFTGLFAIGLFERPPLSASGGPGNVDYGDWKK